METRCLADLIHTQSWQKNHLWQTELAEEDPLGQLGYYEPPIGRRGEIGRLENHHSVRLTRTIGSTRRELPPTATPELRSSPGLRRESCESFLSRPQGSISSTAWCRRGVGGRCTDHTRIVGVGCGDAASLLRDPMEREIKLNFGTMDDHRGFRIAWSRTAV